MKTALEYSFRVTLGYCGKVLALYQALFSHSQEWEFIVILIQINKDTKSKAHLSLRPLWIQEFHGFLRKLVRKAFELPLGICEKGPSGLIYNPRGKRLYKVIHIARSL